MPCASGVDLGLSLRFMGLELRLRVLGLRCEAKGLGASVFGLRLQSFEVYGFTGLAVYSLGQGFRLWVGIMACLLVIRVCSSQG